MKQILSRARISRLEQLAYIGDDLNDLASYQHAAGLGIAVADAAPEVQKAAKLVTKLAGRLQGAGP